METQREREKEKEKIRFSHRKKTKRNKLYTVQYYKVLKINIWAFFNLPGIFLSQSYG